MAKISVAFLQRLRRVPHFSDNFVNILYRKSELKIIKIKRHIGLIMLEIDLPIWSPRLLHFLIRK